MGLHIKQIQGTTAGGILYIDESKRVNSNSNILSYNDSKLGIGTPSASASLHIVSQNGNGFILQDGYQGLNKILYSNSNGSASWIDPINLPSLYNFNNGLNRNGATVSIGGTFSEIQLYGSGNNFSITNGGFISKSVDGTKNTIISDTGLILSTTSSTIIINDSGLNLNLFGYGGNISTSISADSISSSMSNANKGTFLNYIPGSISLISNNNSMPAELLLNEDGSTLIYNTTVLNMNNTSTSIYTPSLLILATSSVPYLFFSPTQSILNNLSGTGSRVVVASSLGELSAINLNGLPDGGSVGGVLQKLSTSNGDANWGISLKDSQNKISISFQDRVLNDNYENIIFRWGLSTDGITSGAAVGTRRALGVGAPTVPNTYPVGKNSFTAGTNLGAMQEGSFSQGINSLVGYADGVPYAGVGGFALGTSNTAGGRSSGGIGRGNVSVGDETLAIAGSTVRPKKQDTTVGNAAVGIGLGSEVTASRAMSIGPKVLVNAYEEIGLGIGNLTQPAFNKDSIDSRDIALTIGTTHLPEGTPNTSAGTSGQLNALTVFNTQNRLWGKIDKDHLRDLSYENEFIGQLKLTGKLYYGVTSDISTSFVEDHVYIHIGATATLTLPDPTLAINNKREIAIVNMGTADLTLSQPIYFDNAPTFITLLSYISPNNRLSRVICFNNKWNVI